MKYNQLKEVQQLANTVVEGIRKDPENYIPVVPESWTEGMIKKFDDLVEHGVLYG